jgi:CMP-N,N'-diacetyllegionaminic acid synthase
MIGGKKVLALIPARGGSKGLPRKNIIDLCGRPLLGWPVMAAKHSRYVDRIVVSTDDAEIAAIARQQGAEVPFLRPEALAADDTGSYVVIEHALSVLQDRGEIFDYLILLEPTSPLTEAGDIDKALEMLDSRRDLADSIVGVSRVEAAHPVFDVVIGENGLIKPWLGGDFSVFRRQDISELYFLDGSLYASDVAILLKENGFYHDRTLPYVTSKWQAFEVDDKIDLIIVEALLKNLEKIRA